MTANTGWHPEGYGPRKNPPIHTHSTPHSPATSLSTTFKLPPLAATCTGPQPLALRTLGSAPDDSSSCTAPSCALEAARCSGAAPATLRASGSAPADSSACKEGDRQLQIRHGERKACVCAFSCLLQSVWKGGACSGGQQRKCPEMQGGRMH